MNNIANSLYRSAAVSAALICFAAPAAAQYKPQAVDQPATGESYHIEGGVGYWFPSADVTIASGGSGALSGLPGSQIDAKRDLGLTDQRFPEFQLQLRPARSHKFRLNYTPVTYSQSATLNAKLVFNGIAYNVGLPVNSTLDWKTYEIGYEYDFVVKNWGFVGFDLQAKYTDVNVSLSSPVASEFAHARGPIPALGGIARYYVVPNISITGEVTAFKIPDTINSQYNAHYIDIDVYGTLNITNNIGVNGGYRSRDVGYLIKSDSGAFVLRGIYFGAVLRY